MNARGDTGMEVGVAGVEDAPAQNHLDVGVGHSQTGDGGTGEGGHLVGQHVGRLA